MNVVYSFIGEMPTYIITSVRQLRLFFSGAIYLIYDRMSEHIKDELTKLEVTIVHYDSVKSERFVERQSKLGFEYVPRLGTRAELFARSYERFYLLHNLMILHSLEKIWFMELDIMMYMSPVDILPSLEGVPMAYAYHRANHCNSGIFFVRGIEPMDRLLETLDSYINRSGNTEMQALHAHFKKHSDITMFPLCPTPCGEDPMFFKDHGRFDDLLFDGAILSILYFGFDPIHTGGRLVPQINCVGNVASRFLNIWKYGNMKWERNADGLNLPYF
jgi:hypothetical protein